MTQFRDPSTPPPFRGSLGTDFSVATGANATMRLVYLKMTLGLVVTALVSLWCSSSVPYLHFMATNGWFMWVLFGAEIAIVLGVSAAVTRLSSPVAALLFYAFAVVNGLLFAPLFLMYTATSIVKTFFITAGTFGAMSVYGYFTSRDLTRMGSLLFMALIGLIIVSVVNIFTRSTALGWIISAVGVLIFVGLTAWDTQQIRRMAEADPGIGAGRLSTLGALTLYLDFINLFLYLLRFFGASRD